MQNTLELLVKGYARQFHTDEAELAQMILDVTDEAYNSGDGTNFLSMFRSVLGQIKAQRKYQYGTDEYNRYQLFTDNKEKIVRRVREKGTPFMREEVNKKEVIALYEKAVEIGEELGLHIIDVLLVITDPNDFHSPEIDASMQADIYMELLPYAKAACPETNGKLDRQTIDYLDWQIEYTDNDEDWE